MAYCRSCGAWLDSDQAQFCGRCGARTDLAYQSPYDAGNGPSCGQPANPYSQYGQQSVYGQNIPTIQYSMKWYKFLIYFALFAAGALNILNGLLYFSGMLYASQSDGQITADLIYNFYGNGLKVLDVCMGIVMVALGIFTFYTRFQLSAYRARGPVCLYILYAANAGITILYGVFLLLVTGLNQLTTPNVISSVVTSIVMVFVNQKYFTNREALFCN